MGVNLHAVASSGLLRFKSDWEIASFSERVLYCGGILLFCIWIFQDLLEYRDRLFKIVLTGFGLLLLLVFGLRKREPPVAVLSLGLNEAGRAEEP